MAKTKRGLGLKIGAGASYLAVFLALSIAFTVILNIPVVRMGITYYWIFMPTVRIEGDASIVDAAAAEGEALAEEIALQGIVMAVNRNNSLPLSPDVNAISVYGWSSTSWVGGGSGSGRMLREYQSPMSLYPEIGIVEALHQRTIPSGEYDAYDNPTRIPAPVATYTRLQDFYRSFLGSNGRRPWHSHYYVGGALRAHDFQFNRLVEPRLDQIGDDILIGAANHSETAIVVLSRVAGESIDLPKVQYKATPENTPMQAFDAGFIHNIGTVWHNTRPSIDYDWVDASRHYLEISTEEEALLTHVGQTHSNVIVLINSTNAFQMCFMDRIPGLSSALIVGATGLRTATAIPKLLWGEVNPSGRLVNILPYDFRDDASWANTGQVVGLPSVQGTYAGRGGGEAQAHLGGTRHYIIPAGQEVALPNMGRTLLYPMGDLIENFAGPSRPHYMGLTYIDYVEGIFIGYRWFETAAVEGFWNNRTRQIPAGVRGTNHPGAMLTGYDAVVQFPFGFGLSFTDFRWDLEGAYILRGADRLPADSLALSSVGASLQREDRIRVYVRVTNTGTVAGRDVVQLYVTPPYNEQSGPNAIEKSHVTLTAFAKTVPIAPNGGYDIVALEFDVYEMRSFDTRNYSGLVPAGRTSERGTPDLGVGGYVVEAGNYYIRLMNHSNDFSGERFTGSGNELLFTVADGFSWDYDPGNDTDGVEPEPVVSRFTGEAARVENGGDGAPLDGTPLPGSVELGEGIVFMTRANFAGTFPTVVAPARTLRPSIRELNQFTESQATTWLNLQPAQSMPAMGVEADMRLSDYGSDPSIDHTNATPTELALRLGSSYYHPDWDALLAQLNHTQMRQLTAQTGNNIRAMAAIGKPQNNNLDGPNQWGGFTAHTTILDHPTNVGVSFPNATTLAQTFNFVLAYRMGLQIGRDAQMAGLPHGGWYAPGINLHRSPLGGRNFEYYSEDPLISGIMASWAVRGARNEGIYTFVKHLALYDHETNRDGLYIWSTEQAARELYLRPFRIAVIDGGVTGIMTAYGRVGAVYSGGSNAMNNGVARGEWGFRGALLRDWVDRPGFMMMSHALRHGGSLAINGYGGGHPTNSPGVPAIRHSYFEWDDYEFQNNAPTLNALRRANRDIIWMWVNAKYYAENYDPYNDPWGMETSLAGVTFIREYPFNWVYGVLLPMVWVITFVGAAVFFFFAFKKEAFKFFGFLANKVRGTKPAHATVGDGGYDAMNDDASQNELSDNGVLQANSGQNSTVPNVGADPPDDNVAKNSADPEPFSGDDGGW